MTKVSPHHARLWLSTGVASVLFFLLPAHWATMIRLLVCWNTAVLTFLISVFGSMSNLSAEQLSERYRDEDETAPVILVISIIASISAIVSIVAFPAMLREVGAAEKPLRIALVALTVIDAWMLIPTMFTLHYVDMFYSSTPDARPLRFPGTQTPTFWDFAYFSFTIAVAFQTADVTTTPGAIRKVLIAQSVLSFLFNAAILGLAINVTAGLAGGR